jgi:hypothetical protein
MKTTVCLRWCVTIIAWHYLDLAHGLLIGRPLAMSNSDRMSQGQMNMSIDNDKGPELRILEAKAMLEKANEIRNQLPINKSTAETRSQQRQSVVSKWNVQQAEIRGEDYRLYIDIGREEWSWMDPRWAASGRRIEFTLDVRFTDIQADADVGSRLVADNIAGPKSTTRGLLSASHGRLNKGFNEMKCRNGAYRIDQFNQQATVRFLIPTDGTPRKTETDVWIPSGDLHFSLPVFGNDLTQLSQKEGIVSVRQMGWNTGWRRMESRVVGVFRAGRLEDAKRRDCF